MQQIIDLIVFPIYLASPILPAKFFSQKAIALKKDEFVEFISKKINSFYRLIKFPRLFNNSELFFDIKSAHEKTLSYNKF